MTIKPEMVEIGFSVVSRDKCPKQAWDYLLEIMDFEDLGRLSIAIIDDTDQKRRWEKYLKNNNICLIP